MDKGRVKDLATLLPWTGLFLFTPPCAVPVSPNHYGFWHSRPARLSLRTLVYLDPDIKKTDRTSHRRTRSVAHHDQRGRTNGSNRPR